MKIQKKINPHEMHQKRNTNTFFLPVPHTCHAADMQPTAAQAICIFAYCCANVYKMID